MVNDKIPAFEIVKANLEKIDNAISIDNVKFNFDRGTYIFLLSKNENELGVAIERSLLDDLNDYRGTRTSKYWLSLEGQLINDLLIPLQLNELIPLSSDTFFDNVLDFEDNYRKEINVSFEANEYEIFQDGLMKIYDYLKTKAHELERLKLRENPYTNIIIRIKGMIDYREQQIKENGSCVFKDRVSLESRIYLKASAVAEIITLENELSHENYNDDIRNAIKDKIKFIFNILKDPIFEKVKIPEFLISFRKEIQVDHANNITKYKKPTQYDVVFSFAGEDRKYVEQLASLLGKDDFKFFYDKFEEHELWGKNLYEYLSDIYSNAGRYCVMFISEAYAKKQWTTLERRSAQERAFKENEEYILPIRLDDTKIPGILDTVAYQDLREKSIEEIYDILKQKLSTIRD